MGEESGEFHDGSGLEQLDTLQDKKKDLYLGEILGCGYMIKMAIASLLGRQMPDHDYYPDEDASDPQKIAKLR